MSVNKIETIVAPSVKYPTTMMSTEDDNDPQEIDRQQEGLQELEDLQERVPILAEFISTDYFTEMLERLDSFYDSNPSHPSAQLWKDFRNKNEAHVAEESK